jgi:hypothetical protein
MFKLQKCRHFSVASEGPIEKYLLGAIGVRPYRCMNCDAWPYTFSGFKEESLQPIERREQFLRSRNGTATSATAVAGRDS